RNHRQPGLGRVPSCDGSEGQRTAEPGENRRDVENQNDGAITQNGSAADQVAGNDFSGEGFDDQFFFADEAVHNETKALFGKTDDDHEIFCFFGARGLDRVNAIKLIEADEGEDLIAQAKDFALVHFVNFLILDASNFDDGGQRNGEQATPDTEEQGLDASQGQGDTKLNAGAESLGGSNVHGAFEAVEDGAHDVHAYTTSGNFSDFRGGAEARFEDEVKGVLVADAIGVVGFDEAVANGVLANEIEVHAAAIVANFDNDLSALMVSLERDGAARGFAGAEAHVGGFDTMINGVADQVGERLGERVKNPFVQVGVFAGNFQGDVFAAEFGDIADNPGEAAEQLFDRNHADFEDALVQFVENTRLESQGFGKFHPNGVSRVMYVELGEGAMEHGFADDELTDEVHDCIDAGGIHTKRAFGDSGYRGRTGCLIRRCGLGVLGSSGRDFRGLGFEDVAEKFVFGGFGVLSGLNANVGNDRGNPTTVRDMLDGMLAGNGGFDNFDGSGGEIIFGPESNDRAASV